MKYYKKITLNPTGQLDQRNNKENQWFFLPQYCFDNNCLDADTGSNEMNINFPSDAIDKEFESQQRCTTENCILVTNSRVLFDFYGVTNFQGYYRNDMETTSGSGFGIASKECDKFSIEKGNQTIKSFLQFYARKNESETSKSSNSPVNIDISLLSEEQKKILINSNESNPVKIYTHKSFIPAQGIGLCYSFVKVLGVKKI